MVENCGGGSGYSAETQGRLGFKGLICMALKKKIIGQINSLEIYVSVQNGKTSVQMQSTCPKQVAQRFKQFQR